MNAYNMNTKTTLLVIASVFVGFLAIGTPYTQYYSVGQAYIVEGISDTKEVEYYQITEEQYKADPLHENPRTTVKNGKTYNPEKAYKIEMWNTNPDATSGNWLPSGSYVVQDMGTKDEADDIYMVCHSGKDCRGNKNLEMYLQGETPDLRANLQASLIETAYAAIANENTGQSTLLPVASVSSQSFSYTSPATLEPFLLLCAGTYDGGATGETPITSVTYNGDPLTFLGRAEITDSNTSASEQWYLQNFTTGSSTMVINYTGTITYGLGFNSTYSGVSSTTPIDHVFTSTVANSASYSPGIIATTTDAYISDCKTMTRSLFSSNGIQVESPAIERGNMDFIALNWGLANTQATTTQTNNRWVCTDDDGGDCATREWTSVLVALTQGDVAITHVYNQLFD